MENIAFQSLQISVIIVLRAEIVTTFAHGNISARNAKTYKICELRKAIFSVFYNISRLNFSNFTTFESFFPTISFFAWICPDQKLLSNANCLFERHDAITVFPARLRIH